MYKQCDGRWGGQELGTCAGTTICQSGCAMTSGKFGVASDVYSPGVVLLELLSGRLATHDRHSVPVIGVIITTIIIISSPCLLCWQSP
jgi:hypothetical protein